MKKLFSVVLMAAALLALNACDGGAKEPDPELKNEIIELESTNEDLDSTLMEIKSAEAELDAALADLDIEE